MQKIRKILNILPSLPKTIYFNIKYFGLKKGYKLPVFVSKNVLLNKTKGSILIESPIRTGMIKIGFGYVPIFDRKYSRTVWNVEGNVVFKGSCTIGHGSKIGVGGYLVMGNNFSITAESIILCGNNIIFGDNVLISWQCQIMDCDFHKVFQNKIHINPDEDIIIGNNVWIGSRVSILKGTTVADNCIIAAGSLLAGNFKKNNSIIAGVPAKIIKENIEWYM